MLTVADYLGLLALVGFVYLPLFFGIYFLGARFIKLAEQAAMRKMLFAQGLRGKDVEKS